MQQQIPTAIGLKYFARNEKSLEPWPINPDLKCKTMTIHWWSSKNHFPSCSEGTSHFLSHCHSPSICRTGFCFVYYTLWGYMYIDVRRSENYTTEIHISKAVWATVLEFPEYFPMVEAFNSSCGAGKTQSGKNKNRTSKKNKHNLWLAESDSGTGPVPPTLQVIHHQHHQRMPGCQIFRVLWGNHAFLYIGWFHVLAREKPSERETRTGLPWEQQLLREDLSCAMRFRTDATPGNRAVHLPPMSAKMHRKDSASRVLGMEPLCGLGQSMKTSFLRQKCSWALH